METQLKITGNWSEIRTKLKEKFIKLTDDDLFFKEGKEDELLARLERKLGKSKEEISDTIEKLQSQKNQVLINLLNT